MARIRHNFKGAKMKTLSQICLAFVLLTGLFAQGALAKPPHKHFEPNSHSQLPQIKGIAYEIFANASEDKQIKALQIEANYKEKMRKDRHNERQKLELEKKILQVKFYHAKAKNDETQSKNLLNQIHQNEQALLAKRQDERNLHDKLHTQKIQEIYNALR